MKKKFDTSCFLILVALSLALTGCAKERKVIMPTPIIDAQDKEKLTVAKKVLDEEECLSFFSKNIIKSGIQPIHLHIKNRSDKEYTLSVDQINMALLKQGRVARKLYHNTAGRVLKWTLGGLFIWPLLVPAVMEGVSSVQANNRIDDDLTNYCCNPGDVITIKPYATINKFLFVNKKQYVSDLSVRLFEVQGNKMVDFVL